MVVMNLVNNLDISDYVDGLYAEKEATKGVSEMLQWNQGTTTKVLVSRLPPYSLIILWVSQERHVNIE